MMAPEAFPCSLAGSAKGISIGPISASERITLLDILRGVALWGVLASDMIGLSSPDHHFKPSLIWTDTFSRIVAFLLDTLVSEKFITIFAVIFGIGFAIQMERAAARGLASLAIYRRRLLVLLLFGFANGLLIWAGDILVTYALFGFLLMLFRKHSQKTVLFWIIGLQAAALLMSLLIINHGGRATADRLAEAHHTIALYSQGTWSAIQTVRTSEFFSRHLDSLFVLVPFVFPRFLFGLWLWRSGFAQNIGKHRTILLRLCFGGILLGAAGEMVTAVYSMGDWGPLRVVSVPLLSAGYASAIALLLLSGKFAPLAGACAAVGRTSLSNYIFQKFFCTMLFYSYGFGLYGKISPLSGFIIGTFIYSVELLASRWWIKRFQFGPLEWLWRSVTYRRRQPMMRLKAMDA